MIHLCILKHNNCIQCKCTHCSNSFNMCYLINQSFNILLFSFLPQRRLCPGSILLYGRKRDVFKVMLKTGKHKTKTNYMFRSQENQSTNSASRNQIHLQRVYSSLCTSPRSSSKDMKWTQESLRSEKPQEEIKEKRKTKKRRKLFNLNMRMFSYPRELEI